MVISCAAGLTAVKLLWPAVTPTLFVHLRHHVTVAPCRRQVVARQRHVQQRVVLRQPLRQTRTIREIAN
jgi:hypothetical protein